MAVSESYTPPPSLGLRQRHPLATGVGMVVNENSNPNGGGGILLSRDDTNNDSMMKIGGGNGATTRRPPPPRASLTTSRPKFNRTSPSPSRSKTAAAETQLANDAAVGNRSALALVPTYNSAAGEDEENLSLWVVGYGYRNEVQFRILYHQLSTCGNITSRRGGLSCFGERTGATTATTDDDDAVNSSGNDTTNWVAVKYESQYHAHKALCLHATITNVHGSTVVMGVLSVADEPGRAMKFGIIGSRTSSDSTSTTLSSTFKTTMTKYNNPRYELMTEADILLNETTTGRRMTNNNDVRSSLCGKILAWFFSWD